MSRIITVAFFFFFIVQTYAQESKKCLRATKTNETITIDGELNEIPWKSVDKASDFIQYEPLNGKSPRCKTEVSVLYSDYAIYIGATLFDSAPDSILREIGERDDESINADFFAFSIFPFNDGQNNFRFKVSASGVQIDIKNTFTNYDIEWDAVWKSKVKITKEGWIAEIEIPYSAIRFSANANQTWGINFWRNNRRYREISTWSYINNKTGNDGIQSGTLTNINEIKAPIRLSFIPYVAAYLENSKLNNSSENKYFANGGMDLKYGINKSFTIDMTLIPDFSQVESDNKVLDLSPFEVKYDENRPFFTEGTDLFTKADLFYSRRIGDTPKKFNSVSGIIDSNETIISNPSETSLINATKFSGRTNKGLGIGFFNAITAEANAKIKNIEGIEREITTQPLSNYNILVADQTFGSNSYLSLINTNVIFEGLGVQSNISGSEFKVSDNSNKFSFKGVNAYSQNISSSNSFNNGFKSYFEFGKSSGNFRFNISNNIVSDKYNQNYLGYIRETDYKQQNITLQYKIFSPFGSFQNLNSSFYANRTVQYSSNKFGAINYGYNIWTTLKNYLSIGNSIAISPVQSFDFYESREYGRFFKLPPSYTFSFWLSPDYRKKLAIDFNFGYFEHTDRRYKNSLWYTVSPRVRVSNRLSFIYEFTNDMEWKNIGYIEKTDHIIFGSRDIKRFENQLTGKYAINSNAGFSLKFRHYWSVVEYNKLYILNANGSITESNDNTINYSDYNTNFNVFNIDLIFRWRFAPGSELNIIWKNNIINEGNKIDLTYFDNLSNTIESPQINSLSIKFIYYIDYLNVKKLFKQKN